jgi:hypothetical protein
VVDPDEDAHRCLVLELRREIAASDLRDPDLHDLVAVHGYSAASMRT